MRDVIPDVREWLLKKWAGYHPGEEKLLDTGNHKFTLHEHRQEPGKVIEPGRTIRVEITHEARGDLDVDAVLRWLDGYRWPETGNVGVVITTKGIQPMESTKTG